MDSKEVSVAKYYVDKMKEQRKYFEYADMSQNILEQQKDDDLLLLQDWLTNVHNGLKPNDKRKSEIVSLIQSVWRVEKYCGGLETVAKASTVRVVNNLKRIQELESQNKILDLQRIQDKANYDKKIKQLEEEIKFINSK